MKRLLAAAGLGLALGACNEGGTSGKSLMPIPPKTMALMAEKGMSKEDPILVRVYKKESELEVWKRSGGKYAHLKTFPICRWSGQLGPKTKEGDRQAPEGFYTVTPAQLNPNSSFYLSFDTGYPNSFDRSHGRTGSHLMVHGDCSSRGCYAMTDEGIGEVYALAREALGAGQRGFQLQAYPFRMTAENLAKHRSDPHMPFWRQLKQGNDHFEVTGREPKVAVCGGRYSFDGVGDGCKPDPTLAPAVAQKDEDDRRQVAEIVAKGAPAVRLVYADGGGHESFRKAAAPTVTADAGSAFAFAAAKPARLGTVSRPEALAEGPREVLLADAPAAKAAKPSTAIAALSRPTGRDAKAAAGQEASPVAALERRTVLASADPDALPALPAPAPEKPFYERMIGRIAGSDAKAEPAPAAAPPPAAAAAPSPSPRKPTTAAAPADATPPAKPKAAAAKAAAPAATPAAAPSAANASPTPAKRAAATPPAPVRHADAKLVAGAQSTGPSATGFTR